ncbi:MULTISPECIES: MDR family MFS transporter [Paenibacillus]|uniref:Multidrug resistance protein n=1 Tax=Paenibacillus albilobatus TaxID=2716884 RepID=A0A920C7S5_9BACL|nr:MULTISPECIES: MFS transporter [Paenibacillus]GIO29291.1 multidrug resistance protein [Paenibacillus albilobatus]
MLWFKWDLNLKIRLIGDSLFNMLFWMYFPFMTLYFSGAFGKSVASMLMMVPPLVGLFAGLFGGFLADRLGRRPAMLLGSILQSVMFAIFALSPSRWLDYIAYIGVGVGSSIFTPASSAMVADVTPEKDRRMVFATFVTGRNLGAVFGPALGSIFFINYRTELLWTCTLVTFLYFLAIYWKIRETLPASAGPAQEKGSMGSLIIRQFRNYGLIFKDPPFAVYIIAGIMVTIAFMQLDMYLAVYVKEYVPAQPLLSFGNWSFSLNSTGIFGWMIGLNGLLFVLCALPVTKLFEHWNDRNVFILSSALFGLGMFLMGFTTNVWLLLVFITVMTIGEVSRSPVTESFVSKYAPANARGQYMGASNLQYSLGRFIAPVTIFLSTWLPPLGVFGFIFFCTLASVVLYIVLFRILPETKPAQTENAGL